MPRRHLGPLLAVLVLLGGCSSPSGAAAVAERSNPASADPPAASAPAPSAAASATAPSVPTGSPQPVKTFADKPPQAQYREFPANCTETQRRSDDPIVFPGLPGASHNHTFVGNPAVDASSTPDSLRGGQSSCQEKRDASSYWFPTLLQGGAPVPPQQVTVYYKSGVKDYRTVQPFPAGFRLIVGDLKTPSARQFGGTWSCGGYLGNDIPASCPDGSSLIVRLQAPSCWDGVHLDSPDHRSHMAWPVDGACPKDHPVPLPMFELKVPYKLPGGVTTGLQYSSGPSYTFHYDFMNGWDAARQAQLVEHCINGGRQCNSQGVDQHKP
ncbi:DUF1996 domain-containing protein [Dactylosporangium sp. CA-092794]|uniref:DUF1996 domain-containing protein n=1 Tax=Dactylosporangium sp. CA-092794 TaxID=3239929 RepID=UPI003D8ACD38